MTGMCGSGKMPTSPLQSLMAVVQARPFLPSMFIAQLPQMPSRQERRKVRVASTSFLILSSASRTIGPQASRSISKVSRRGRSPLVGSKR